MTIIKSDIALKNFHSLFNKHNNWLVITGAGISAASGIPTYRDATGTWQRSEPIKHQEFLTSESHRKRYWSRSFFGWPPVAKAKPNNIHRYLKILEDKNKLTGLITQNVDRLHQKAAHKKVIDLHGRLDRVKCTECGLYENRDQVQHRLLQNNFFLTKYMSSDNQKLAPDGDAHIDENIAKRFQVIDCEHCGGLLMPDVVFFGGSLSNSVRKQSMEWFDLCDGVIALGTSLTVYSSFKFCKLGKKNNKPLIIVNQGVTRADEIADLKLNIDCEKALSPLLSGPCF